MTANIANIYIFVESVHESVCNINHIIQNYYSLLGTAENVM